MSNIHFELFKFMNEHGDKTQGVRKSVMPDMDKVIKGLETCKSTDKTCSDCPYNGEVCTTSLCDDVLSLLKEQEEIIHCKDCYYYRKPEYGFTIGDCTYRTAWYPVAENEFCSLAKRKKGR